jgi:hypothetical protein
MLWRLVGAGAAAVQLILLVALAAGALPGPGVPAHALLFLPGVAGGALLATNVATARSPGALDNVSGVLAVLAVLDRLPPHAPVGVILPDAEELGLVGARAFARGAPERLRDTAVINFDGIGDRGATRALLHRPGPLVADVARAVGARPRRWLPVLVDGLAFAPAARECITLLKGDWRTARIVHTPRDTADRLTLDGVADVAERVAGVLAALTARE